MCKVTRSEVSFTDIMKSYRLQPQAKSHVYRSVLLIEARSRKNSVGSGSQSGSGSVSPNEDPPKEGIRSTSTLPVSNAGSQPPTPTRLAGSGQQFDFEERGDVIMFYNQVYVPEMKEFILKFSMTVSLAT